MILHDIWTKRSPNKHPYLWLGTDPGELCPRVVAQELAARFPMIGFRRSDESRRPHGKQYSNYSRPLGHPHCDHDLSAPWRELLAELHAPAYRDHVARMLGQQPARALELRLVRHGPGDGLSPHTDRDDKIFSHVIYLNRTWHEDWGGCRDVFPTTTPAWWPAGSFHGSAPLR